MEEKALYLSECTLVMKGIEPGLYVFSGYSKQEPQGKTYLATLLNRCKEHGDPVSSFTYTDVVRGLRPLAVCRTTDEVILLDRYDLYTGQFADDILTLAQHAAVLVAAQAPHFLPAKFKRCILDWEEQDRFRLFGA